MFVLRHVAVIWQKPTTTSLAPPANIKPVDDFERAFIRIRNILKEKKWPGVEEGQSWGTPSLKVKGKMLVRVREPGVLVIMCNLEAKEMLLQVAPHIYFDLPHY